MQRQALSGFAVVLLLAGACSEAAPPTPTGAGSRSAPVLGVSAGSPATLGGASPALGTSGTSALSGNVPLPPPAPTVITPPAAGTASAPPPAPAPVVTNPAPPATVPRAGTGAPLPAAGTAAPPATPPGGTPAPAGAMDPVVPMITGDCPKFANGSITYMGLGGITVAVGAKAAGKTAPMLFYWHGTGSTAGEYALMAAAISSGITSEGGVIVSFDGTTGGDLLSGTAIFGAGDFKLTDQFFACAVRDYNVDPRKVYSTGCSAGGLFAGAMGALRSTYMAAVSSNSGGWVLPQAFENKHTPALMTVHGASGVDVVIIDFSDSSKTADMGYKTAGGFVINCDHGGGHCGGTGFAGDMWKFFKAHPFGVSPEPWMALPAGFSAQCKIF